MPLSEEYNGEATTHLLRNFMGKSCSALFKLFSYPLVIFILDSDDSMCNTILDECPRCDCWILIDFFDIERDNECVVLSTSCCLHVGLTNLLSV